MDGGEYNDWLGSASSSIGRRQGSTTSASSASPSTGNMLAQLGARAANKILGPSTTAAAVPVTSFAPQNTTSKTQMKTSTSAWSQFKHRVKTEPEVKWSLIAVCVLMILGVTCFLVMMISMRRRCKKDAERHQVLLREFEKKPASLDHARILSSPVEGGMVVEGTNEHVLESMPPAARAILSIGVIGVGNAMMQDFAQATDTTLEMKPSARHAMLLSCQNRLNWLESLAVPPVIKQLNGFDVIDMKIRINSAIQDIILEE